MLSPGWLSPRLCAALGRRFQMIARENETLLAVQAGANADPSARQRHAFGPLDSAPGLSPLGSECVLQYVDPEQLYCG